MTNEKKNIPKPGDPGVFEVTDKSWLKPETGYAGKEDVYAGLDIENAPDLSEEEWKKYMAEEKSLRQQFHAMAQAANISMGDRTLAEAAQIIQDNGLANILSQWSAVHLRNKAIQMKRGISVLLVPQSQMLLKMNEIIENKLPKNIH